MADGTCIDCGQRPATAGRFCQHCVESTAAAECIKAGLPPGGRNPDEVRREIRLRRAAATLLLGRLTDDHQRQANAMQSVVRECYVTGAKPGELLVPSLLNLIAYVAGVARAQLVDTLREAGTIAAAEADLAEGAELIRDCQATEAAAAILVGRLTFDAAAEAHGRALAEALAERHLGTSTSGLLFGPIMGLINDRLHGHGRGELIERLDAELMLTTPALAPDTLAALDDPDATQ